MTGKEYLSSLTGVETDEKKNEKLVDLYADNLPEIILKIVANGKEPVFLDNDSRVLSFDEIVDAENDLHIAFREKGIIPIVDCGENDFVVYHFIDKIWSKFNIIDETVFKKKESLEEIIEK